MELGDILSTSLRIMMVARLLTKCPAYPVTKAVLSARLDEQNKYKQSNYRMITQLEELGYVAQVDIKGVLRYTVDCKRLLKDFKELPVVRQVFHVYESTETVVRIK